MKMSRVLGFQMWIGVISSVGKSVGIFRGNFDGNF
jgi:hypothetical protein